MAAPREPLTIYSDYVCPFCYLGRRALEEYQAQRDAPLPIEWHPFDLRSQKRGPDGEIDHSVDDGKDEAYFDQVRENVAELRERYDAEAMLDLDELPEDVDSLDAQVASVYVQAEHPEAWQAFDEAVFEALWVEGRDIGDPAVLARLAADAGLDGEAVQDAIAEPDVRERVHEQFQAAQRAGVTGVPTFTYDGYAARGAVPPGQLARLVEGA